jgi:hypothetical protein
MALPASGPISMSQVNTEIGRASTATTNLNETRVRLLAGVTTPGATISMSNLQGKQFFGAFWTYSPQLATSGFNPAWPFSGVWTGSYFVIAGNSGKIATSPDGTTWTNRTQLSTTGWSTNTQGNAMERNSAGLIVVGGNTAGRIATSSDGITWTYRTGLQTTTWGSVAAASVNGIAWNGSVFCAVGNGARCATSTDGATWTYQGGLSTALGGSASTPIYKILWTGSQFVAVGLGPLGPAVLTSPNGATWTNRSSAVSTSGYGSFEASCVAWSGSVLCIGGPQGRIAVSSNGGVSWTYTTSLRSNTAWQGGGGTSIAVVSLIWAGTTFVAGGPQGQIATSTTDGLTWTYQPALRATAWANFSFIFNFIFTGSQLLAIGQNTRCATSP